MTVISSVNYITLIVINSFNCHVLKTSLTKSEEVIAILIWPQMSVPVDIDNSNAEVDPPEDDLADTDNEEDQIADPIKLREYQTELAELGLTGKNVVICAPTGSGKTLVALKIMRVRVFFSQIHFI